MPAVFSIVFPLVSGLLYVLGVLLQLFKFVSYFIVILLLNRLVILLHSSVNIIEAKIVERDRRHRESKGGRGRMDAGRVNRIDNRIVDSGLPPADHSVD